MESNERIAQEVNKLIEKNNDACLGYRNAAENVSNTQLKSFFERQATTRNRFANELKSELQSIRPTAELNNTGSLKGDLHRGWMDIKAAFSNESEEEVLEECIRGEKASMEEYHEVLENVSDLPQSVSDAIQKQHQEIHNTIKTVQRLEDLN